MPALQPEVVEANMSLLVGYGEAFVTAMADVAGRMETTGVEAAGKLAESGQKVFSMGKTGVEFLEKLATLGSESVSAQRIDVMVDVWRYVVESIAWLAYQIAPEAVTAAATFAAYGQQTFSFVKIAADALNEMATKAVPDQAKIDAFVAALRRVLGQLQGAVADSAGINGALGAIGANLGMPPLQLPVIGVPLIRPTGGDWTMPPPVIRPGCGGGGGGGGGGSGTIKGFDAEALAQLFDLNARSITLPLMATLESVSSPGGGRVTQYYLDAHYAELQTEASLRDTLRMLAMAEG